MFCAFVSIVVVVHRAQPSLGDCLVAWRDRIALCADNLEIIVVDCRGADGEGAAPPSLAQSLPVANLQVLQMQEAVTFEVGAWAGLERSLGDRILLTDGSPADLCAAPQLISPTSQRDDLVYLVPWRRHCGVRPPAYLPKTCVISRHLIQCIERLRDPTLALRDPGTLRGRCAYAAHLGRVPGAVTFSGSLWAQAQRYGLWAARKVETVFLGLLVLSLGAMGFAALYGPNAAYQGAIQVSQAVVMTLWLAALALRVRALEPVAGAVTRDYQVVDTAFAFEKDHRQLNVDAHMPAVGGAPEPMAVHPHGL